MMGRKRLLRLYVQLACLAGAIVLLWPLPFWGHAPRFIAQASPFLAICSGIALRALSIGTIVGWVFSVIALFRRRWFCIYVCPVGLLVEGASRIGFRKISWWNRCPPFGQYAALLTAIGGAVGYPLLLWMDPLSIFTSPFAIRTAGNVTAGILGGVLLGLVILLSLTSGAIWCARICPLGGMQDMLALARSRLLGGMKARLDRPVSAVSPNSRVFLARRAFILSAAGIGMGLWAKKIGSARGENAPLRPPGAVLEKRFTGLCLRCGNCVRACPSKIIRPDTGQAGVTGFLAPMIRYGKNYCREDCNACTQICPSGALGALSLKQKNRYVIGEALVDGPICLLVLGQKDCDACMQSCPFDAVRIHWDEELYLAYPVVDAAKCNGCGACEVACPTFGDKAIRVWKIAN